MFDITLDKITSAASDAVIVARNFCADEVEAARASFMQSGVDPTEVDLFNAIQNANLQWDRRRQSASQLAAQA